MLSAAKLLFMAFMTILLGVVLIQPISNDIETTRDSSITFLNESVAITSGAGTLANDEGLTFTACRNSTMDAIVVSTNCNVTLATGEVLVEPHNFSDNLAYIDYTYEPDTYVHSSTARTLLVNTRLFFAMAVMVVGIGFAIAGFKQSGIM